MSAHEGLLLIAIGVGVYIFPTALASWRGHRNAESIAVVNVLLGWTVVGWVVALAWAVTAQHEAKG